MIGRMCLWFKVTMTSETETTEPETASTPMATICKRFNTCASCTNVTDCNWLTETQACHHETAVRNTTEARNSTVPQNSTVADHTGVVARRSCPTLSVSYEDRAAGPRSELAIRVKVSNDSGDRLRQVLRNNTLTCRLDGLESAATMDGDDIVCTVDRSRAGPPSSVLYLLVRFGDVELQFDQVQNHYVIARPQPACQGRAEDCASCFWDDEGDGGHRSRYYCKWCSRNDRCTGLYQHCDVRDLRDPSVPRSTPSAVRVNHACRDARIQWIEPAYGPWAGGTTIRVSVKHHQTLAENRFTMVTVAGRRCLLPTVSTKDDGLITCTISPANATALEEGPVEVTYVPKDESLPRFTLSSEQMFYFVDPEVVSVRPACGRVTGGTVVTVRGNFLNAGSAVRVFVNENVTCAVREVTQNEVECVTNGTVRPAVGRVRLEFDGYLTKYAPHPHQFRYVDNPSVDAGQTFRGIAAGGTRVSVRGRNLECVQNPFIYVRYKGLRLTSACQVINDTYMECRTPKINRPMPPRSAKSLPFGFQADFDKQILMLVPPDAAEYALSPDPVISDYESDGETVVINGLNLDHGYLPGDLSIRLPDLADPYCNVTEVTARRIVCTLVQPKSSGAYRAAILVVVGKNLEYEVKRKSAVHHTGPFSLSMFLGGITLVSLIITVVVSVIYCMKIVLMASNSQTEMESLCKTDDHKNNGAYDDEIIDAAAAAAAAGASAADIEEDKLY